MAVDPLDNSSERFITFTMNEIKFLAGFMHKIKELFPEEGHYFIHKTANILLNIFEKQLAVEDKEELGL